MTSELLAQLRRLAREHDQLTDERRIAASGKATDCRSLKDIDADINKVLKATTIARRKLNLLK